MQRLPLVIQSRQVIIQACRADLISFDIIEDTVVHEKFIRIVEKALSAGSVAMVLRPLDLVCMSNILLPEFPPLSNNDLLP